MKNYFSCATLLLVASLVGPIAVSLGDEPPSDTVATQSAHDDIRPLKGLLITGGCCHDYKAQEKIVTEGMSQRVNITWDVVHEGGGKGKHKISKYSEPDWAMGYDVIFHNECFGGVADADFIQGITAAHHQGVPGIFVHCSLHSYRNAAAAADPWRELIGVTSTRHENRRGLTVRTMNETHPIMKGFSDSWETPHGELYKIQKMWPNCVPLAQAYGEDSKKDHVVAWTNTFGKARIFGTSIGHHNETMNTDVWLDLVARGVLWSTQKLQEDGTPVQGYAGSGIKPILIEMKPEVDPAFKNKPGKKQEKQKAKAKKKAGLPAKPAKPAVPAK